MRPEASFSWNIVTKNFQAHEQLRRKVRSKLTKLERHLQRFPHDAVHLQVGLEKHPKKGLFSAALSLRVPSNILRSEKQAMDPIPALDRATKTLLRQLAGFKSSLRREAVWKRKERRAELHNAKGVRFAAAPMGNGAGPQYEGDVIRTLIERHHAELLRYVRRHLWHEVRLGNASAGTIDARAVVNDVTRQALAAPENRPAELGFLLWLYRLARRELARRCEAFQAQSREALPLEEPRLMPEYAEAADGYEPEQPLDIIEEVIEPPVVETKDLIADGRTAPPDEAVVEKELLEEVQKTVNSWPKAEREAFELHFVEGFEPEEVAMVLGLTTRAVEELLGNIQNRLRETLLAQSAV